MLQGIRRIFVLGLMGLPGFFPAYAAQDAVQFAHPIHIGPGETAHDIVCFACSVDIEGSVEGDVVTFLGHTRLHNSASSAHDVVTFAGSLQLDSGASVGGDTVVFAGDATLKEGSSIGKDLVIFAGNLESAPGVSIGGDRVIQPPILLWGPLLLLLGLLALIVYALLRLVRRRRYRPIYPPPPSLT